MLEIRAFHPDDYPALAKVMNAAQPEKHFAADGLRHRDETRDPKCKHARWVGTLEGRVVGVTEYDQSSGMYHPRKFFVVVNILPECDTPEHRAQLWDHVMNALEPWEPLSVMSYAREDRRNEVEFLESRGYREVMRYWESRLDVASFDFSPYSSVQDEVRAAGFEIRTLAELEANPDYQHTFYDLWVDCRRDVPRPDQMTEVSFEQFSRWTFESPYLLPDACFIALETSTGRWAGMSQLWKAEVGDPTLHTGLTAVRREYRRNKLALAMKLRGLEYARRVGCPQLRTGNESNNRAMLSINELLGFVKQPAWIDFVKVLREE